MRLLSTLATLRHADSEARNPAASAVVNAAQDFRLGDRSARPKLRTPRWHLTHLWRDRLDANRLGTTAAKCQQRRSHSRYQCKEAGAEEDACRRQTERQ